MDQRPSGLRTLDVHNLSRILRITNTAAANVEHGPGHDLEFPESPGEADTAKFAPLYHLQYAAQTESERHHRFGTVDGSK